MWPLIRADLTYDVRTIALFHGLAALNAALLLSIQDGSDTPPIVWLPMVMQGVVTFNLLYREHTERRARLYALLPLSPAAVALARLIRFLLAVLALGGVGASLLLAGGQPILFALSATLLTWAGCLVMVVVYDRFGLTGVQVALLLPGLVLLALLAAKPWLPPTVGTLAELTQFTNAALTRPTGALFTTLLLVALATLHVQLSGRRLLP